MRSPSLSSNSLMTYPATTLYINSTTGDSFSNKSIKIHSSPLINANLQANICFNDSIKSKNISNGSYFDLEKLSNQYNPSYATTSSLNKKNINIRITTSAKTTTTTTTTTTKTNSQTVNAKTKPVVVLPISIRLNIFIKNV